MTFLFLFFCCRVRIPESGTYLELENVSITSIYSRRAPSIALPIQPIYHKIGPNWPNWPNRQCCLAGSSKTAPRILIFSIAMGADYSFYVKTIETHARAFLTLTTLVIGSVSSYVYRTKLKEILSQNVHAHIIGLAHSNVCT